MGIKMDKEELVAQLNNLGSAEKRDVLRHAAYGVNEKTSPDELKKNLKLAMTDMSPIADAWKKMSSNERAALEESFATSGNREEAISGVLKGWDEQFGSPRKVTEITTNRDIYNALKEVYDKSGGDWDMVARVAKYNQVPKDLMDKFVKNGQWTDYSVGDESGSGFGAVARGATDNLYGGIKNILSGGEYAEFAQQVPRGVNYEDQANTLWRAGIRQAGDYGRSLMETDPGMEIAGQIVGSFAPLGVATKATKGMKVASNATKLGRLANLVGRGAATGALYSIPGSLSEDTIGGALGNTAKDAAVFALGDLAFAGAGGALGAISRGAGKVIRGVGKPGENIVKSTQKIKSLEEMSESEIKRGIERGWIKKDGTLDVTKYLADEYGTGATETIDDLARISKGNREVYNQLKNETKDFHYKQTIAKAAEDAMIPNAPLSRVNRILKTIPDRIKEFSDDVVGYLGTESQHLANNLTAFNQDIQHALKSLKNLSAPEKAAVDKYLKEVETANMIQHMRNKLPTEFQAVDKTKTVLGSLARLFNITNPFSAGKAAGDVLLSRTERDFLRKKMAGTMIEKTPLEKAFEGAERARNRMDTRRLQQVINAMVARTLKQ